MINDPGSWLLVMALAMVTIIMRRVSIAAALPAGSHAQGRQRSPQVWGLYGQNFKLLLYQKGPTTVSEIRFSDPRDVLGSSITPLVRISLWPWRQVYRELS